MRNLKRQSEKRNQNTMLSTCHIKSCVLLVKVNLSHIPIVVNLTLLILTRRGDDTNTHCAIHVLTVCLYYG